MSFPAWAAVGTLVLLSACAGGADYTPPQPGSAASTPGEPSIASLPSPATPAGPPSDVQKLVGLKGDVLRQWMGKTVFVRHDGIAEIWRFAADTCFLDVFLYKEADGFKVAHLDARARAGNQVVLPQTCYSQILAHQQRPS